ncbi:MAG: VanZ family protein [Acetatifactor sp.]|nr:VanZ family protein [Acetatifactor sp.]
MKYLIDFTVLILLYAFVFFGKWKVKGKDILLVNTLMYIYLSFVLYFTLMPIITHIPFILNHPYVPMNMVPFIDVLARRGDYIRQVVLNIIMTIPFGFLFPLTQNRTAKFSKTTFFCFLMSLGIEILQPLINGSKSSDITDLITNVFGGMLGYGCYVIFRPVTFWLLDHLKNLHCHFTDTGRP